MDATDGGTVCTRTSEGTGRCTEPHGEPLPGVVDPLRAAAAKVLPVPRGPPTAGRPHLLGEGPLTGLAGVPGAAVAGCRELLRPQSVQLVGDGVQVHRLPERRPPR
ncbi:hypothetical protein [Streptomyces achromogenes]|uniref:hypothetical protein n=1 Tax=Streptomyces achromogenes TaxID=67255 RepID=UPI0036FE4D01